jgi:hypothetical protein
VTEHRNMPPGVPIPASEMPAFFMERDRLLGTLRDTLQASSPDVAPAALRGQ